MSKPKGLVRVGEPKTSSGTLLWGPIESIETARKVRMPSLCLAAFGAAAWAMIAINGLFSPSPYGHWAILYASILSLVAWGLYQMKKAAAVVALVFALAGLLSGGGGFKMVTDLVMLLAAVAAIRGTLSYSLLTQNAKTPKK